MTTKKSTKKPKKKRAVKPNIEKLKQEKDVEGLISALKYKRGYRVRIDAALALVEIGEPELIGLIDELIEISLSDGFLTNDDERICGNCGSKTIKRGTKKICMHCGKEQNLKHFDTDYRHIRALEIGKRLHNIGGTASMRRWS